MPETHAILESLQHAARAGLLVAIAWHVVLALVLFALIALPWRPRRDLAGALAAAPLLSAAAVAVALGNAFNGALLSIAGVALCLLATSFGGERLSRPPGWMLVAGLAAIGFGWVYPHFEVLSGPSAYLFASPVGVLPCPTLAVVVGLALLGGGFRSRTWSLLLAATAAFYGLFGMLRLGVWLDAGLLLAAIALIVAAFARAPAAAPDDPGARAGGGRRA